MQTFTGREYLKIDIANNFGLDKKTWDERIEWFDKNEANLAKLMNQADEPALFFAGVQAWEETKAGRPSGYPISLDATSSGLQLLACMTGDRSAAQLCNVLDFSPEAEAERRDGYTVIYNAMMELLGEQGRITREDTKTAIMTALYGSEAEPKRVFGEGIQLAVFHQVMRTLAPAVWELNEAYLDMWDSEVLMHSWVLPDNFHVQVKVMDIEIESVQFMNTPYETYRKVNRPKDKGRSLGANSTHSVDGLVVREMTRRCNYDPIRVSDVWQALTTDEWIRLEGDHHDIMVKTLWDLYQESGYLSARILDHLDSGNIHMVGHREIEDLLLSLPEKSFEVLSVHDCFRCLPNYGNDLRKQYNNQLMLIAKSNMLQFLISQILKRNVTIGKLDPDMWKEIADVEYALS